MPKPRRRYRFLRALFILLILFELAVHIFLNGVLLRLVNRHPEKTEMQFAWVWCPWPGWAYVQGFRLRGTSGQDTWQIAVEGLQVQFQASALWNREFHAVLVQGGGLSVHIQTKGGRDSSPETGENASDPSPKNSSDNAAESSGQAGKATLETPKQGNSQEASAQEERQGEKQEASKKRPWRIRLEQILLSETQRLQVDRLRLESQGTLQASLDVQPGQDIEAELQDWTIRSGKTFLAARPMAEALEARFQGHLGPVNPEPGNPRVTLETLNVTGEIQAQVTGLEFLYFFLQKAQWLQLTGGEGELQSNVRIRNGRFAPGTEAHFAPSTEDSPIEVAVHDYTAQGHGKVDCAISGDDAPQAHCQVLLDRFGIHRDGYSKPHIRGDSLSLELVSEDLALPKPFQEVAAQMDLPGMEIPDMGFYDAYLPEKVGLELRDGHGEMSIQAAITPDGALKNATLEMRASKLRLKFEEAQIRGSLKVNLEMSSPSVSKGPFDISGSSVLFHNGLVTHPGLEPEKNKSEGWWGAVALNKATLSPGGTTMLRADVLTELRDTTPLVLLASSKTEIPGILKKIITKKDVKGSAKVRIGPSLVDIDELQIDTNNLDVLARFRLTENGRRGLVYAKYLLATAGIEIQGEKVDIKPMKTRNWYEKQPPFPKLPKD